MDIKNMIIDSGLKGVALDGFSPLKLTKFIDYMHKDITYMINMSQEFKNECDRLENISLNELRNNTQEFMNKFFSFSTVPYLDAHKIEDIIRNATNIEECRRIIGKNTENRNIFDLPIEFVDGDFSKSCTTLTSYNFIKSGYNIRPLFNSIRLGKNLTKLTEAALIHEYTHVLQISSGSFTNDYLNYELLSIFLEKLYLIESQEPLKLFERYRFLETYILFNKLYNEMKQKSISDLSNYELLEEKTLSNSAYIKSAFFALKLFDMYLKETSYDAKDKYIEEINDVFNGKKQVEDIIGHHGITIDNCFSIGMVKRHIY